MNTVTSQRGLTLVELLIALLIGLFLFGGLLTVVQDSKRAFQGQNQLSQLQDAERLAMTMMTDVIQAAGYFPDPTTNTATSTLPAFGAMAVGQAMTGTDAAGPLDTITSRYTTANGDGILNCTGSSNTSGANFSYVNTFSVVNTGGTWQLVCTRENGVQYALVNGVTNLSVLYGVSTTANAKNTDTYMTATQVTAAAAWNNVVSVQITLQFTNPLFVAGGQGQPATLTFTRLINVMRKI
jgi:type IV pilus assembly protein PilW